MIFQVQNYCDLLGLNERNIQYINRYNPRKYFSQVDDKIKTKERLAESKIPIPLTLTTVESFFELENALKVIEAYDEIVIKPSKGRAGGGILLLQRNKPYGWKTPSGRSISLEEIETHMGEILFGVHSFGSNDDRVLVEKRIQPHNFFQQFYSKGVADIRIILFKGNPILAMARIPTSLSDGKANLHQGAIGVGVNLMDGTFVSAAYKGVQIKCHPDSQEPFHEQKIPEWKEIMDIAKRASACVDLQYLGVDLVLDNNHGPMILELNARPGLEIQVVNKTPLKRILRKFI